MNPCRRLFTALLLAAVCCATEAHAGAHLRWDACYRDPGSTVNKNFACDTNTGSETIVGSMFIPDAITQITGFEFVLDYGTGVPIFPSWWQFKNAGTCRQNSLAFSLVRPPGAVYCVEYPALGAGGIGSLFNINNTTDGYRTRVKMVVGAAENISAGGPGSPEVFGFVLTVNHTKTVGTGSCSGCTIPICLAFESFRVTRPVGNSSYTYGSDRSLDPDWIITWQGSDGCAAGVPARNETWGAVKQLYR